MEENRVKIRKERRTAKFGDGGEEREGEGRKGKGAEERK
jgi:hypothetical protein